MKTLDGGFARDASSVFIRSALSSRQVTVGRSAEDRLESIEQSVVGKHFFSKLLSFRGRNKERVMTVRKMTERIADACVRKAFVEPLLPVVGAVQVDVLVDSIVCERRQKFCDNLVHWGGQITSASRRRE